MLGRVLSRFFLVFISVAVALLIVEIMLQLQYRARHGNWFLEFCATPRNCPMYQTDNNSGWRVKPEFETMLTVEGNRFGIHTNRLGFRDSDHQVEKSKRSFRILILGDSFSFGWGVNVHEIYHQILKQKLSFGCHNIRFEIINASTPGWGIENELAWFRSRGVSYDPDLVIVQFYPFDWEILNSRNKIVQSGYLVRNRNRTYQSLSMVMMFLGSRSLLFDLVRQVISFQAVKRFYAWGSGREVQRKAGGLDAYLKNNYPTELEEARTAAFRALHELWAISDDLGSRSVLVLLPAVFQIYPAEAQQYIRLYGLNGQLDSSKPARLILDKCQREGWECLDLLPSLWASARSSEKRLYFNSDPHWDVLGHQVAGQKLVLWLQERKFVPEC